MSQEHRFCAEVYARLFPHIDRTKRIVVNPDGWADLPGCSEGETPPDLCFTLRATDAEIRIEAKIVDGTRVKFEESQRLWCQPGCVGPVPHLWIVATRTLDKCWLLEHAHVVKRARENRGHFVNLWPRGDGQLAACNLDELAAEIINWAKSIVNRVSND